MKFTDIIIDRKPEIVEAPQGMLKRAGLGIKKAFGSTKAAGQLDTGKIANQLRKDFDNYLGKTGSEAEPDVVISWLQSQGYPVTKAQAAMPKMPATPAQGGAAAPASGATPAEPAAAPANATAPTEPTAAPDSRIEPTLDNPPAAEPAVAPTEPAASPAAPAGTAAPAKTAPGNAAAPSAQQKQTTQNINNYVQNAASAINSADPKQKIALTKELVNFMADRKDYPEWGNAMGTVQGIIKKAGLDPNFANAAMSRVKAGQTLEAWQVYAINALLEAVGVTWKQIGYSYIVEGKNQYRLVEHKAPVGVKVKSLQEMREALAVSVNYRKYVLTEAPLSDKELDAVLLAAAQEAAASGKVPAQGGAAAPAATSAASGSATAPAADTSAPAAADSGSGGGGGGGGALDRLGSAMGGQAGAQPTGGAIPKELLDLIRRLSPTQKQNLLGILKDPNKSTQVLGS